MIQHYVDGLDLNGEVLEIGGHKLAQCAVKQFPSPRFVYHDLNLEPSDIPNTIIADITDCQEVIPDNSFDIVFSSDVFEHIDRPWLATQEIARILRPGGIAITYTLFSWRNHPCPIDFWRYSAECLEFLFDDLDLLEKGYDLSDRRVDQPGFWPSGKDSVPVDQFGGWREHWAVYHVGRKGAGPSVSRFKDGEHPLAHYLRMDTQGVVTNPRFLNQEGPKITLDVQHQLTESSARIEEAQQSVSATVDGLTLQVQRLAADLDQLAKGSSAGLQTLAHALAHPPPSTWERAARSARRRLRNVRAALG